MEKRIDDYAKWRCPIYSDLNPNFKRGIWEAGTVASDVQIHPRVPGKSACDGSFLDAGCSSPLASVPQ